MSKLIIPFIVLYIILYGFYKKVPLYDTFIDGAKESFEGVHVAKIQGKFSLVICS